MIIIIGTAYDQSRRGSPLASKKGKGNDNNPGYKRLISPKRVGRLLRHVRGVSLQDAAAVHHHLSRFIYFLNG